MCCLNDLYNTRAGRLLLLPLISKPVSDISGFIMDCRISKLFIKPFARKNHIVLTDYELDDVKCFNDFFRRKIRKGLRPVSEVSSELIAPCDGLLKVSRISRGSIIEAKQSRFTVRGMLRDWRLADSFDGGYCFVYRLCVDNYHRYIYFDSGRKHKNRHIRGVYHTVRPVALDAFPVFVQNTREYAVIDTENFGRCVQMEVGAMLVGRIVNKKTEPCAVRRGTEKGYFEYGGSTVIVLLPKQELTFDERILKGIGEGCEIPVKMGETIAVSCNGKM
ncbi:MAG: phosphatidylserine decarboxylase [Lachnospiraceae bacterium]|nr:phosphatidylserine decarboxylase [Lachnospiraceae bacterium]